MAGRLIDRYRKARKKWIVRIADDERTSDACCASCNAPAPFAPIVSRISDAGLVVRTWRCGGCGNEWITSAKVTG